MRLREAGKSAVSGDEIYSVPEAGMGDYILQFCGTGRAECRKEGNGYADWERERRAPRPRGAGLARRPGPRGFDVTHGQAAIGSGQ